MCGTYLYKTLVFHLKFKCNHPIFYPTILAFFRIFSSTLNLVHFHSREQRKKLHRMSKFYCNCCIKCKTVAFSWQVNSLADLVSYLIVLLWGVPVAGVTPLPSLCPEPPKPTHTFCLERSHFIQLASIYLSEKIPTFPHTGTSVLLAVLPFPDAA